MASHLIARVLLFLSIVASFVLTNHPAYAQGARTISATATCVAGEAETPTVSVTIQNDFGKRVHVAYLVSFPTPQAISASGMQGLLLQETPAQEVTDVEDGESVSLVAPWAGREERDGEVVGTLIVTSAGLLMPACGFGTATIQTADEVPATGGLEAIEAATAMAETIGSLEAMKAYPALYALLHPDAQALVAFDAVACSYAATYGPPVTRETRTIYATEVQGVMFDTWTWDGNGEAYERAAEVTFTQETGIFPASGEESDPMMEHLVRDDAGVYRWFFGTDAGSIESLETACGLPEFI